MFCKNCGQQIPDTAKFCGKCGAVTNKEPNVNEMNNPNVNNQYTNNQYANNPNMNNQYANNPNMNHQPINNPYANNFDAKKVMDEITHEVISLVKNPIATVRESKNKDNNSYMIFGLLACLLAILNVYILKSAIVKNIIGVGGKYITDELLAGKHFGIIMKLLINNVVLIGVVSGVIFLIVNVILKKVEFKYFDGLKVVIAGYAYSTIVVFVGAIVSYISLPLGIAIMYISLIAYMILIYEGLSSFGYIDKVKCLYIVLIVMAAMILSQYVLINIQIKSLMNNFNSRYNPMEEIIDSLF